jgi:hypothetical protein
MTDQARAGTTVAIAVALISLMTGVIVAVINNWEKLFVSRASDEAPPGPGTESDRDGTSKDGEVGEPGPPPVVAPTSGITGLWRSKDGYSYQVQGEFNFDFQQIRGGRQVALGTGHFMGGLALFEFHDSKIERCQGQMSTDGLAITGECHQGFKEFPFRLERAS